MFGKFFSIKERGTDRTRQSHAKPDDILYIYINAYVVAFSTEQVLISMFKSICTCVIARVCALAISSHTGIYVYDGCVQNC